MPSVPVSLVDALSFAAQIGEPARIQLLGQHDDELPADLHEPIKIDVGMEEPKRPLSAEPVEGQKEKKLDGEAWSVAPQKVLLPAGAMQRGLGNARTREAECTPTSCLPMSPPPASAPNGVPLSLFDALPTAPPSSLPGLPTDLNAEGDHLDKTDFHSTIASIPDLSELTPDAALKAAQACFPPGLPVPMEVPSVGSLLHNNGALQCRPCAWHWKASGCQNGMDCGYCHLCPQGEMKARKKAKQALMQMASTPTTQTPGTSKGTMSSPSFGMETDTPTLPARSRTGRKDSKSGVSFSDQDSTGVGSELEEVSNGDKEESKTPHSSLPSAGSVLHGTGRCNPCAWNYKAVGCLSGRDCAYCHLCSEGERKNRKKSKLIMMRLGHAIRSGKASEAEAATPPGPSNAEQGKPELSLASLL